MGSRHPTLWKHEQGDEDDIGWSTVSLGETITLVCEATVALYWKKKASSRHGQDLAEGADVTVLTKLMRELSMQRRHSHRNMVVSTVTGSSWTAPHLASSGRAGPARCYRCARHF